ncbi:MAG: L-lactate permease [Chloroflexota bacterium]
MNLIFYLMALSPIILILILLLWKRLAADSAGLIGWLFISILAFFIFKTSFSIIIRSSLAGFIASFPITLMVATSIFQVTIMIETGAIARIVAVVKSISPKDQVAQIMIINIGFGTILASLGATPVSILPPIMLALGYSSLAAIALPSIGYDALCTYALLGIPVVVFANIVGKPVGEVGFYFSRFMPIISSCIAIGMLWIVGRWKLVWKGFIPALLSGCTAGFIAVLMNKLGLVTLTGVAAGLGVIIVMLLYLHAIRKPVYDSSVLTNNDRDEVSKLSIYRAVSPWLLLIGFALLINLPNLPFYSLTFTKFAFPIEIIPGAPEKLRIFWQAYFWILISTICAFPFLRPSKKQFILTLKKWVKRAPRPMVASAVFFIIAYIYNQSGKDANWQLIGSSVNMISVLANGSAELFGRFYPLIAPILGMLAGFISGSETSAIAMLTNLHLSTASKIGVGGLLIAAASGIGGGLASVISPAKLQNAAASIDRIGEESSVLRVTFVVSVLITIICAIVTFFWSL